MEEMGYPTIDEEEGMDMACEPIAEIANARARSVPSKKRQPPRSRSAVRCTT
jgi:hypothetical protein